MKKRVAAVARIAVRMTPMRRCRAMSREDRYSRRHAQSVIVALCKVVSLSSYFLFCLASALAAAADAAGCGIRARAAAIPTPRRSRGLSLQSFRQGYFPLVPAGVGYCAPDAVRHEMTHRRSGAVTKQDLTNYLTRSRVCPGTRGPRGSLQHHPSACSAPGCAINAKSRLKPRATNSFATTNIGPISRCIGLSMSAGLRCSNSACPTS
jgi:hypothetical protein